MSGIKFTFGDSQSAQNLMGGILQMPEYAGCKDAVCRKLGKQIERYHSLMAIEHKDIREATLVMWHNKFKEMTDDLPELVKTHTRCVETGFYRDCLRRYN